MHKSINFFRCYLKSFSLVALMLCALPAFGDDAADLKGLISQLNMHVIDLEKRVKKLENPPRNFEINSHTIKLSEWRKIELAMSENEVLSLLGDPVRIAGGSLLTHWYYSKNARVTFDSHGVYSWSEPN